MSQSARIPTISAGGLIAAAVLAGSPQSVSGADAGSEMPQTHRVFGLDDNHAPTVDIDEAVPRSSAIEGILAMLAFQVTPSGCEGPRGDMDCPITRELGLGRQCSEAHLAMVERWFPDSMPQIGGDHAQHYTGYAGAGPEAWMCAQTPEGANVQDHLVAVDLWQDGDLVAIDTEVRWYAREESGLLKYRSEFRIEQQKAVLVSHRRLDRALGEYRRDEVQEKASFVEFIRNLLRW
jgi:hypothetical protein